MQHAFACAHMHIYRCSIDKFLKAIVYAGLLLTDHINVKKNHALEDQLLLAYKYDPRMKKILFE